MKVSINAEYLLNLGYNSKQNGTIEQWSEIAFEWLEWFIAHKQQLNKELQDSCDLRDELDK